MSSVSGINAPPVVGLYNNSGMDIEGIIAKLIAANSRPITLMQQQQQVIKTQQSAYTNAQTKVQALLDSIKALTKRDVATGTTLFDSMLGTSTDATIAKATATGTAASQTLNLEVISLATATRASSTTPVGQLMTAGTTLSSLGITEGTFTVFAGGTAYSVSTVGATTIDEVLDRINTAVPDGQINAKPTVVDGKIQVVDAGGTPSDISFGAVAGDTSNFLAKVGLLTAKDDGTGTLIASKAVNLLNVSAVLSSGNANLNGAVSDGTFTINGVTFNTTGKSLSQVITDINNNADVKVTANFNMATNKLELTSKVSGSTLINLADGTSGFLAAMGLTAPAAQTAGTNAEFVLNGTTMYSATNTADETVTGISGVTLNLVKAQPGSTIQIGIQKDKETITKAIQDVLTKYNEAIAYIDVQTNAEAKGPLAGESRLTALRNQIRGLFTSQVGGSLAGTAFDSLQQVGIGTTSFTAGGKASPELKILDATKLTAALDTSPELIKKLFIGQNLGGALDGTSADDGMDGVLTQIQNVLSDKIYKDSSGNDAFGALYNGGENSSGLFISYQTSATARIKRFDDSIDKAQDRLDQEETRLRKQFTAMDQLIGQYQAQGSAVTNLINQLNAESS